MIVIIVAAMLQGREAAATVSQLGLSLIIFPTWIILQLSWSR